MDGGHDKESDMEWLSGFWAVLDKESPDAGKDWEIRTQTKALVDAACSVVGCEKRCRRSTVMMPQTLQPRLLPHQLHLTVREFRSSPQSYVSRTAPHSSLLGGIDDWRVLRFSQA